jgi:hypothetical protein
MKPYRAARDVAANAGAGREFASSTPPSLIPRKLRARIRTARNPRMGPIMPPFAPRCKSRGRESPILGRVALVEDRMSETLVEGNTAVAARSSASLAHLACVVGGFDDLRPPARAQGAHHAGRSGGQPAGSSAHPPTPRLSRRAGVLEYSLDGEALLWEPALRTLFHLNDTARFIWRCCDGRTLFEVAEAMIGAFDVELDQARTQAAEVVGLLTMAGLLREDPAHVDA